MCGICGRVDPAAVDLDQLQQMTEALAHRGPDGLRTKLLGPAGFGHTRLSIIDLDGGAQPMSNEDGSLWITFNGEIYNYRDLRPELARRHRFATNSDTEVILHLYEDKRERCVDDLRGMFAFAIWDNRERSLFLARDHLGQKPLYYVHHGRQFAFASELKALLAVDPALREMDWRGLYQYLTLRIVVPPRTMFADIRQLPPGHTLLFKDGRVATRRYWQLAYQPKVHDREADLLDELEHRVLEAVRYHMVSDVPVGAFLSGGLDSGLIVGLMSRVASEPVKTFSVGVPYRDLSELPDARLVAERFGTCHVEETIAPSLIQVLPDLVWHLDEPSDPLSACMFYIARMARRHTKVVLGGDGGDELFGGYDRYYGTRLVDYYAVLPEVVRRHVVGRVLDRVPDGFWYKSLSHKLKWMNQLSFQAGGRRYAESLSYFYFTGGRRNAVCGERLRRTLDGFDPLEAICAAFDSLNAEDAIDKMLLADTLVRLPNHSVMILDRTTMAFGLEARSPFMDHKLVEFVARVPTSLKVRGRTRRYLQRRLAERYLPPGLLNKKKQGFASALPYLLAGEFRQLFTSILADAHLVRDGYLEAAPIARLLSQHMGQHVDHGNRLWLLANAEIWYRMAVEGWNRERLAAALQAPTASMSRATRG